MVDPLPPEEELDGIFTLPDSVDEAHRDMYEVIVTRLRRESVGLPLNTIQLLLLERIARNYIVLRIKEDAGNGEGGFAHATAQKEFNTFWLSMTVEFNRLLRANEKGMYDAVMHEFVSIMESTLTDVLQNHPELAAAARNRLADELDQRGI